MRRSVNTSFWSDPWVEELAPTHKLLFLYLLTNENTNMLGIYETSVKRISFDTGIDKETVRKALEGFESIGKVFFKMDRYIVLPNFLKHQNMNPNMQKSAVDVWNGLPKELKPSELIEPLPKDSKGFQRLSKGLGMLSKIEVEVEEEIEGEEETPPTPKGEIPTFDEFLEHAKQKAAIAEVELNESECRLKYESWKDAGWKTGGKNSRKIKNWKNTLTNSIKYMSKPKTTKSGIYAGMSTDDFIKREWSEVMADAKSIGDDIHE